jgi:hypothetical protein
MWPISFFSVFQQQLQHVYLSVFWSERASCA